MSVCEPSTGWMYCTHADALTVCRCSCTCLDQRHCGAMTATEFADWIRSEA